MGTRTTHAHTTHTLHVYTGTGVTVGCQTLDVGTGN